jgi:hypothetical protein
MGVDGRIILKHILWIHAEHARMADLVRDEQFSEHVTETLPEEDFAPGS